MDIIIIAAPSSEAPSTNKPELTSAPVSGVSIVTSPPDAHNDTTVSEISADITLDSVKDHTV